MILLVVGVFTAVAWLMVAVLVVMPLEDACYCGVEDCDCVGFDESEWDGAS